MENNTLFSVRFGLEINNLNVFLVEAGALHMKRLIEGLNAWLI